MRQRVRLQAKSPISIRQKFNIGGWRGARLQAAVECETEPESEMFSVGDLKIPHHWEEGALELPCRHLCSTSHCRRRLRWAGMACSMGWAVVG